MVNKLALLDRHMPITLDWSSHSRAPFAGERGFSKSRGFSASVSFLPLPTIFLTLALAPTMISRGQNTVPVPFLGLSLLPNPTETLAMQATVNQNFSIALYKTCPNLNNQQIVSGELIT